jgi:hypothetical protein
MRLARLLLCHRELGPSSPLLSWARPVSTAAAMRLARLLLRGRERSPSSPLTSQARSWERRAWRASAVVTSSALLRRRR